MVIQLVLKITNRNKQEIKNNHNSDIIGEESFVIEVKDLNLWYETIHA